MASQLTKRAIEASLKRLLQKKSLDKITVSDITEDCGINRMTFYYHFKDIYDLVEWTCAEESRIALDGMGHFDDWTQGYLRIFEHLKKEHTLVMNIYHCFSTDQVRSIVVPLADQLVMGVVEEMSCDMVVRDEDKAFIARVYSYTLVGLLLDWMMGDMRDDPKALIARFSKVVKGDIMAALGRFRTDNPSKTRV